MTFDEIYPVFYLKWILDFSWRYCYIFYYVDVMTNPLY